MSPAVPFIIGIVALMGIAWWIDRQSLLLRVAEQRNLKREQFDRANRMHALYSDINDQWHKDGLRWQRIAEEQYAKGVNDGRNDRNLMLLQESGEVKMITMPISDRALIEADQPSEFPAIAKDRLEQRMVIDLYEQGYGLRTSINFELRKVDDDFSYPQHYLVGTASCVRLVAPLSPDHLATRNPTFAVEAPAWWWASSTLDMLGSSVGDEPRAGNKE